MKDLVGSIMLHVALVVPLLTVLPARPAAVSVTPKPDVRVVKPMARQVPATRPTTGPVRPAELRKASPAELEQIAKAFLTLERRAAAAEAEASHADAGAKAATSGNGSEGGGERPPATAGNVAGANAAAQQKDRQPHQHHQRTPDSMLRRAGRGGSTSVDKAGEGAAPVRPAPDGADAARAERATPTGATGATTTPPPPPVEYAKRAASPPPTPSASSPAAPGRLPVTITVPGRPATAPAAEGNANGLVAPGFEFTDASGAVERTLIDAGYAFLIIPIADGRTAVFTGKYWYTAAAGSDLFSRLSDRSPRSPRGLIGWARTFDPPSDVDRAALAAAETRFAIDTRVDQMILDAQRAGAERAKRPLDGVRWTWVDVARGEDGTITFDVVRVRLPDGRIVDVMKH